MKGYDVYKRALNLLGYEGSDDNIVLNDSLEKRSFDLINQILSDLGLDRITTMTQYITVSDEKMQALCYGLAMLISLSEGDSAKNAVFAQIYNAKRASCLNEIYKVEDNLPTVSYGVD